MHYYLEVLKKYAVFKGRARRKEYWMFVLFNLIFGFVLGIIEVVLGIAIESDISVLSTLYGLAVMIPAIAVSVRRLHDTNHSGWWFLISLVPLIGGVVLFIFMVQDSQPGENQYGPNPKELKVS